MALPARTWWSRGSECAAAVLREVEGSPLNVHLFEALLSAAPVGAALFDARGRYLWVNETLAQMNGLLAEEHVGRTIHEVVPTMAEEANALLAQVRDGTALDGIEISGETPDRPGELRTWIQSWFPIEEGDETTVAVLVWEITDQQSAAAAQTASMERLRVALQAGGMGTWDWDLRADLIHWDDRTAGIFGVSLDQFDGSFESFGRLLHPDDLEAVSTAISAAIETRGEFRREYRILRSDGEERWVSARGRVIVGADGEPEAMIGVIQDRTDTHSQGEKLARTLEAIDEAFYSLDRAWRFTYVNARAEKLLLTTRDVLLGAELWELFPTATGSTFESNYRRAMEEREAVTFEAYFAPLELWVEVRAYPDPDGIAVYFRDIGERKQQELERASREALQQQAHEAAARLLDVSDRMHAHTSPAEALAAACEAGIEVFRCMRVAIWRIDDDGASLLAQSGGNPLPRSTHLAVDERQGMNEALASGGPIFYSESATAMSAAERDLARRVGARSFVYAPVELGGRSGTLLAAINWADPIDRFDDALLGVAARYAQQTALVVEQARRRQAQIDSGRLSAQLQASLLPAPVSDIAGFEIASLYDPGERRLLLGGDFYDIIAQPDGGLGLVIGDVTGHGPEAAAIGASLRAGWRTMALNGAAPAEIVQVLDALLRSERATDEQLVSICCACIDPQGRTARFASAGHPAPLLTSSAGTAALPVPIGLLLGLPVDEPAWDELSVELGDRWALLLYTDGLPEARCGPSSVDRIGFDGFADHVAAQRPLQAPTPAIMLRELQAAVRARAGQPIDDDVALLLVRRT